MRLQTHENWQGLLRERFWPEYEVLIRIVRQKPLSRPCSVSSGRGRSSSQWKPANSVQCRQVSVILRAIRNLLARKWRAYATRCCCCDAVVGVLTLLPSRRDKVTSVPRGLMIYQFMRRADPLNREFEQSFRYTRSSSRKLWWFIAIHVKKPRMPARGARRLEATTYTETPTAVAARREDNSKDVVVCVGPLLHLFSAFSASRVPSYTLRV